jgi:anaerobic magnesium-protoporphyrin IX monomethyl ester cyclase
MNKGELNKMQPRFPRRTLPGCVFSTWEIHYECNYHCTYCHAPKPWHPDVRKAAYLEAKEWIKIWQHLYEEYGSWYVLISGGEPFIYPDFIKLIIELSKLHFLEICTNFSWEVEPFINNVNPKMTKVSTSFHPEFADLDKFLIKLKLLKDNGFDSMVNFVPWPPLLSKMAYYKQRVEEIGVPFVLQPFIGEYEKRRYPQGYTEAEREHFKIFKDRCNIDTFNFKTTGESNSTKGKKCRMGENYAFIHPDGEAHRCCKDKSFSLGNVINGSFRLLDEAVPCAAQECNCWRCMLAGKEEVWSKNWKHPAVEPATITKIILEENITRVALIQPPVWGVFDPPVALAQLSSCLRQRGFQVKVFDLNIELYRARKEEYKNIWAIEQSSFWCNQDNVLRFFSSNGELVEEYIDKIIEFDPESVGFSVNNASFYATLEFARKIKQRNPETKIILGGPMFLVFADIESIMANDCIDIVVFGEGEETFIELLEKGADADLCKGIIYKKEGKIIKADPRPLIKDLDGLAFLDFSDLSLDRYDPPGHLGKHISLMVSRGCIQNCVFCGPKAYWFGYRSMSGERIYEEIQYHLRNNPEIENIEFLDLLFNGDMKTLNEFCNLMISSPIKPGLSWHANVIIRPEMTPEVLSNMKKAGCHHLTYGIESGSQRVLNLMRKRYRIEDADKVLKYTHEAGIEATCNFMFGFPGESEEDFQQTLEFLKRNAENITKAYPSRTYCTIEPHSYLEQHMEEFDMVPNAINNIYWESKDGRNTYPGRLKRCEIFSSLATSSGVSVGLGLQTSVELDRWYNLGFYYESKNDYKNAIDCFSKYLRLDAKNETIINRLEQIINFERADGGLTKVAVDRAIQSNGQVSFNWDINWICNYRCPYCWFYGKWAELKKHNRNFNLEEWVRVWKDIYARYGAVKIAITGGEPFLYPNFVELIKELSQMHKVEIITNLSIDIQKFVKDINTANVKVNPSFHPLFADFDKFIERVLLLKEVGLLQCVSYLAWPPQINKIGYYTERFSQYGVSISIQSFFGEHKGIKYPDGYTELEKQIILPHIGERGGKPFQTEPLNTMGRLCAAGYRYGVIHPDAVVLRCGGINYSESVPIVGNLFEDGFKLLDEPSPCTYEMCVCNEWAFLLKDAEK